MEQRDEQTKRVADAEAGSGVAAVGSRERPVAQTRRLGRIAAFLRGYNQRPIAS